MRLRLLTAAMFSIATITYANQITNELNNHNFILKNWTTKTSTCLEFANNDKVYFSDCFKNDINDSYQRNKALNQIISYENNRLYLSNRYTTDEKYCLSASDNASVQWSKGCDDNASLFDIIPHKSSDSQDAKFLIKNQAYGSCLTAELSGETSLKSCEQLETSSQQYFAAALNTPMIQLEIGNLNGNSRDLILEIQDENEELLYEKQVKKIKTLEPRSLYFPDFQAFLQRVPEATIRTDDSRWRNVHLTTYNLRTADKGKVTIDNKAYRILFSKHEGNSIRVSGSNFVYAEDQNSLAPYANTQTTHSHPDGAVVAFFEQENFDVKNGDAANIVLKFDTDIGIEKGKSYQSVRVLRADKYSSFKISNAKGGLTWISGTKNGKPSGTLTYSGLLESGAGTYYAGNYGLFNRKAAPTSAFQRGKVFCNPITPAYSEDIPDCAMLKTDAFGKNRPFTDQTHWQVFQFNTHTPTMNVTKGALYYQKFDWMTEIELWYAKKDGVLSPIPRDKKGTDEWFFMGDYHELLL